MDRIWEWVERQGVKKAAPQISAVARARQRKKTCTLHINSMMKKLNISFNEAAILLDIPESDWDMYRKILEEKRYSDI